MNKYCSNCKEITSHERWNDGITIFESCERVGCHRMETVGKIKKQKGEDKK